MKGIGTKCPSKLGAVQVSCDRLRGGGGVSQMITFDHNNKVCLILSLESLVCNFSKISFYVYLFFSLDPVIHSMGGDRVGVSQGGTDLKRLYFLFYYNKSFIPIYFLAIDSPCEICCRYGVPRSAVHLYIVTRSKL